MDIEEEIKAELRRIGDDNQTALKSMRDDLDRLQTALRRSRGATLTDSGKDPPTLESKAFAGYLRRGTEALIAEEVKALTVSDDTRGGYLAPGQFSNELIRALKEASPLRRLARGVDTEAGQIDWPTQTAGSTASWVGELETRPESELRFGGVTILLHELATYIDVSAKLLDDSAIDVEALLSEDLGEAFAAAESTAFITGNGVKKPFGMLPAAGLPTVPTGSATLLTGDGLITAAYALKPGYRRNASWLMNNTTAGAVRKLKSTSGDYLWQDQGRLIAGQPPTLLGYNVEIEDNMPDVGANALPILFGDFRRGYFVLNKPRGLSILRDPFTQATVGKVRFHSRLRVGGALVRTEALVAVKVAVS